MVTQEISQKDFLIKHLPQIDGRSGGLDAPGTTKVGKGLRFYENQLLDCVTVTVCRPMVSVPTRVILVLKPTRKLIVEFPLRTSGSVTFIQFTALFTE